MAVPIRNVSEGRYVAVPGAPPPLHTMAVPVPQAVPIPASRPPASGGVTFSPPPPVRELDPSDRRTWPTPDAVQFSG